MPPEFRAMRRMAAILDELYLDDPAAARRCLTWVYDRYVAVTGRSPIPSIREAAHAVLERSASGDREGS